MSISLITLPDLTEGQASGYAAFVAQLETTYAQLATAMGISVPSFSTIATGQGDPVDDANKFKALANQLVSAVNAASGGGVTALDFTVAGSEGYYAYNAQFAQAMDGLVRHYPLAASRFATADAGFTMLGWTNYESVYLANSCLDVYVNDTFYATYVFTQAYQNQTFTVTGLPTGQKVVTVFEGGQYRANEQGVIRFSRLLSVTAISGGSLTRLSVVKSSKCLIVFGDSRTVGGGVQDQPRYAWPRQVGRLLGYDVYIIGYASLQQNVHLGTDALRAAHVSEVAGIAQGYAAGVAIWYEAEVNDFALGTISPAQIAGNYAALFPLLAANATLASARVVVEGSAYIQDETETHGGYVIQDFRNAEQQACQGVANVTYVDGRTLASQSTLVDTRHYNAAGEQQRAIAIQKILAATASKYTVLDSQNFDQSTSLPPNYGVDSNFVVVSDGTKVSGTNSLRQTNTQAASGTGPNVSVLNGEFNVVVNLASDTGYTYLNLLMGMNNGNAYKFLFELADQNNAKFYFQRNGTTISGSANFANPFTNAGFLGLSCVRNKDVLSLVVQRLSDGLYLNSGFSWQAAQAVAATITDNSPLPEVAGTCQFFTTFSSASANNVVHYDNVVVASYD